MMQTRRRHLTIAAALCGLAPLRALAAERTLRIGATTPFADLQTFRALGIGVPVVRALGRYGYTEGRNLVLDVEPAPGLRQDWVEQAVAALVRRKPDLLLASSVQVAHVMKRATREIPIVVWGAHGAVETGLVDSLRRPGGNVTGIETLSQELDTKRMELFKRLVPGLGRLAVLTDDVDPGVPHHLEYIRRAAASLGVRSLSELRYGTSDRIDDLLAALPAETGGLLLVMTARTYTIVRPVFDFALTRRLPTMGEFRREAESGCLMTYGPTFEEIHERLAAQIAKILRGTPAAELPMEQPTRFELVINQKTARAIGIQVPRDLLLRADAVIA